MPKKKKDDESPAESKARPKSYDPWQIRINAPPPPAELQHLLGPNDICDPNGLAYREFDWRVDESHVDYYFKNGAIECKNIARTPTADGELYTIVNGRHWLVAARLAAKRRDEHALPPLMVNAGVDHYDNGIAWMVGFVTNKKYDETPAQKGRDVRTYMRQTGINDTATVAKNIGVSEQTIKSWLARADEEARGIKRERKTNRSSHGLGKKGRAKVINRLMAQKTDEAEGIASIIDYIDGNVDALKECPQVFIDVINATSGTRKLKKGKTNEKESHSQQ